MKPTVSDRMARRPLGSVRPRMVGSSVANKLVARTTAAPVRR
jgi:hypothetical protein